jgi:hypothetical protein
MSENIDETPRVFDPTHHLYTSLPRLSINPEARFEYTSAEKHVLDSPVYQSRGNGSTTLTLHQNLSSYHPLQQETSRDWTSQTTST